MRFFLKKKKKKLAKIDVSMMGLFSGDESLSKEDFERMLKINGCTTLSHLTRAYVHATTSLSNMPTILTPMTNFVEFFKNKNEEEKNN